VPDKPVTNQQACRDDHTDECDRGFGAGVVEANNASVQSSRAEAIEAPHGDAGPVHLCDDSSCEVAERSPQPAVLERGGPVPERRNCEAIRQLRRPALDED
jgi:hypothetical protein